MRFPSRAMALLYAADVLAGRPLEAPRSVRWPAVRRAHLKAHPTCAACGGRARLNVHHLRPFHLYPELELDPENLLTLCEGGVAATNCHLLFGHGGNWSRYNPTCVASATANLVMIAACVPGGAGGES
jgi:5-methylcytosine-specific restriction protein A